MQKIKIEFDQDELFDTIEDTEQEIEAKALTITNQHLFHRLNSERMLEEILPDDVQIGASYHFISGGDVDSFSFLQWLLRKTRLKRCLCSTWCISKVDIEEFHRQIRLGRIAKMDFYVGEILPKSYPEEYAQMGEIARDSGGRLAVFRNHSKVMAGIGEKFSFAIESSANVNTNPRTEQTVVTIDRGIADFYFSFFDGIISFDKEWRNGENQTDRLDG